MVVTNRKIYPGKNPGILIIRQKEPYKGYHNNATKKGIACLVSDLYAVTAAFLIKNHEKKKNFDGLFVTRGQSLGNIREMISHNLYNPENQHEYDIGIIKVSNLRNFGRLSLKEFKVINEIPDDVGNCSFNTYTPLHMLLLTQRCRLFQDTSSGHSIACKISNSTI